MIEIQYRLENIIASLLKCNVILNREKMSMLHRINHNFNWKTYIMILCPGSRNWKPKSS